MKKNNFDSRAFSAYFHSSTRLWEIDQFVDKFRKETDKKDEFSIDLKFSEMGTKVFFVKQKNKKFYH
tara:strand:- start:187 stop:387 length:201 start_codon:yes stop_codon:yes gene_type:complete